MTGPQRTALFTTLAIFTAHTAHTVHANYKHWLTVGRGGLPYNFAGYLVNVALRIFAKRGGMLETDCYSDPAVLKSRSSMVALGGIVLTRAGYGAGAQRSCLTTPLPQRAGPRPPIHSAIAPQRQVASSGNGPNARALASAMLESFATDSRLEMGTSKAEGHGAALFLKDADSVPAWARVMSAEIAHFHADVEGSGHCTLLPRDAKEVVEKGWGQRHALSGGVLGVPVGMVLLYAPRDEEEVEVLRRIVMAAIGAISDPGRFD